MFKTVKTVPTVSTAELTLELGMNIYWKLMEIGTIDWVIKTGIFDPENIIKVNQEVDRMIWVRGLTELDTSAEYDEETGEITKEATYKEIPVVSEILDVETIFTDFPLENNAE